MNVVQVRLLEDNSNKRYTYALPEDKAINKDKLVRVRNHNGKEKIGITVTDSEHLSANAIDMIMQGQEVQSCIIGRYHYKEYSEVKNN